MDFMCTEWSHPYFISIKVRILTTTISWTRHCSAWRMVVSPRLLCVAVGVGRTELRRAGGGHERDGEHPHGQLGEVHAAVLEALHLGRHLRPHLLAHQATPLVRRVARRCGGLFGVSERFVCGWSCRIKCARDAFTLNVFHNAFKDGLMGYGMIYGTKKKAPAPSA